MMKAEQVFINEMSKSGNARVVKVPDNMRPTTQSLNRLNNEIYSQIERNVVMRTKSFENNS